MLALEADRWASDELAAAVIRLAMETNSAAHAAAFGSGVQAAFGAHDSLNLAGCADEVALGAAWSSGAGAGADGAASSPEETKTAGVAVAVAAAAAVAAAVAVPAAVEV